MRPARPRDAPSAPARESPSPSNHAGCGNRYTRRWTSGTPREPAAPTPDPPSSPSESCPRPRPCCGPRASQARRQTRRAQEQSNRPERNETLPISFDAPALVAGAATPHPCSKNPGHCNRLHFRRPKKPSVAPTGGDSHSRARTAAPEGHNDLKIFSPTTPNHLPTLTSPLSPPPPPPHPHIGRTNV